MFKLNPRKVDSHSVLLWGLCQPSFYTQSFCHVPPLAGEGRFMDELHHRAAWTCCLPLRTPTHAHLGPLNAGTHSYAWGELCSGISPMICLPNWSSFPSQSLHLCACEARPLRKLSSTAIFSPGSSSFASSSWVSVVGSFPFTISIHRCPVSSLAIPSNTEPSAQMTRQLICPNQVSS